MTDPTLPSPTLRARLRDETNALHDRLDASLAPAALAEGQDYAAFLAAQYRARGPIEEWLAGQTTAPPPAQTPLIARDLAEMNHPLPPAGNAFVPPSGSDPLGVAWVLAGSSLGNRAILARRRKRGLAGPVHFLSDDAMPRLFQKMRAQLEQPVDEDQAEPIISAAKAAFEQFILAQDNVRTAA